MKIDLAIREAHRSERGLARMLVSVAERHKVEHEVYHVARDLASWSREHITALVDAGQRYGIDLSDDIPDAERGLFGTISEKLSEATGGREEPALLLLADLRRVHIKAVGVSVDWELLGQGAQAVRDAELLALTKMCHPQTTRQAKWANTMIKNLSPQVLAS